MKIEKEIAYCYPTSPNAERLGGPGYYISNTLCFDDGSPPVTDIAQGCHEVFENRDDPDLWALFSEADGVPSDFWIKHCIREGLRFE